MMIRNQRGIVLGELGVMWISYGLVCAGWRVYRPISETGYDLLAERDGKRRWIEVKARDPMRTTGKNKKYVTVGQSPRRNAASDYLAVYLHGTFSGILVPASLPAVSMKRSKNSTKLGEWEAGVFTLDPEFVPYLDNYDLR